ncbi:MAG: DUF427 domain-containing protein [Myxococcota bacterium]
MSARIRISPHPRPVEIVFDGFTVAYTKRALRLEEQGCPPRIYVPEEDVNPGMLAKTSKQTFCPHKGTASYYSVLAGGKEATNGTWVYENPIEGAESIQNHLCFDESLGLTVNGDAGAAPAAAPGPS